MPNWCSNFILITGKAKDLKLLNHQFKKPGCEVFEDGEVYSLIKDYEKGI